MKPYLSSLFVFAVTASTASAQCYQFSGSGATLQINITSFVEKTGPVFSNGGYVTSDLFESDNSLTVGGATMTSQSTANTPDCVGCSVGSVNFNYSPGAVTAFTMSVPANNTPGTQDSWFVVLGGVGDVIPGGVLPVPAAFPPISMWVLPANENNIVVNSGPSGKTMTDYPITAIGSCSSTSSGSPSIGAAVNGASFQSPIVPNSWATITGSNLSPVTDTWANAIVDGKLPTKLDSVTVSVGGKPAYVYYISSGQINLIVPEVGAGPQQVIVTNSAGTSTAFAATVSTLGPAYFLWPGNQAVATRQDFSLAAKAGTFAGVTTVAAKPGDVIILWGTGFGPTSPAVPEGEETPSDKTYSTPTLPTVKINGVSATVYGAALAPGFAGLYQVAIQVPSSLGNGDWPVETTIGGVQSPIGAVLSVKQ
jgi:uncharacterized protein (TIGR03437 family)